jgi:hypothetical protein
MDLLKQIFTPAPAETTTQEKKTETETVVEQKTTTAAQDKARASGTAVKQQGGVTYTKQVECQPQKEIERIREVEIGTSSSSSHATQALMACDSRDDDDARQCREGAAGGAHRS